MTCGSTEDKLQQLQTELDGLKRSGVFTKERFQSISKRPKPKGKGRRGAQRKRPAACCWYLHIQTLSPSWKNALFTKRERITLKCNAIFYKLKVTRLASRRPAHSASFGSRGKASSLGIFSPHCAHYSWWKRFGWAESPRLAPLGPRPLARDKAFSHVNSHTVWRSSS